MLAAAVQPVPPAAAALGEGGHKSSTNARAPATELEGEHLASRTTYQRLCDLPDCTHAAGCRFGRRRQDEMDEPPGNVTGFKWVSASLARRAGLHRGTRGAKRGAAGTPKTSKLILT